MGLPKCNWIHWRKTYPHWSNSLNFFENYYLLWLLLICLNSNLQSLVPIITIIKDTIPSFCWPLVTIGIGLYALTSVQKVVKAMVECLRIRQWAAGFHQMKWTCRRQKKFRQNDQLCPTFCWSMKVSVWNKNPNFIPKEKRDTMAEFFFMADGEVPWQWNVIQ